MSLHPLAIEAIPEDTLRVAKAAFRKGKNPIMVLRDHLSTLFSDQDFLALYSALGQPAYPPYRLMLVSVFQYMENLSDRQAANAVRARIDWKYALGLSLTDSGFDASILTEFRNRLVENEIQDFALNRILEFCKREGLIKTNSKQRTDSTHVMARIRHLNRLTLVGETVRAALNTLAVTQPQWILAIMRPEWETRYVHRVEDFRLPKSENQLAKTVNQIRKDGQDILDAIQTSPYRDALMGLPSIRVLSKVWQQQFDTAERGFQFKPSDSMVSSGEKVISPYDDEAAFSKKGEIVWEGYKVHLSETCDDDLPSMITSVVTTGASVPDQMMGSYIQDDLEAKDCKPTEHLVDGGYLSAAYLEASERLGIEVIGPIPQTSDWQSKVEGGITMDQFEVDWEQHYAQCPAEKRSISWRSTKKSGVEIIQVRFAKHDCQGCPLQYQCTRSRTSGRTLQLKEQKTHELLAKMRLKSKDPETLQRYQMRSGIESTISQGVRGFGLRYSRYLGLEKTTLQHTLTAAAINFERLAHWWSQTRPTRAKRPPSAWGRLLNTRA